MGLFEFLTERATILFDKVAGTTIHDWVFPHTIPPQASIPDPKAPLYHLVENDKPLGFSAFQGLVGLSPQVAAILQYRNYFDPRFPYLLLQTRTVSEHRRALFLIFEGYSGVGKTECSKRMAAALGVPLLVVEPGNITGKSAGETCLKLLQLRKQIQEVRSCVVLFDEIDSLLHREMTPLQVRTQFRQLVEGPTNFMKGCNVMFVATTNDIECLDSDVVARATMIIPFPSQFTHEAFSQLLSLHAKHLSKNVGKKLTDIALEGQFVPRDIVKCCERAEIMQHNPIDYANVYASKSSYPLQIGDSVQLSDYKYQSFDITDYRPGRVSWKGVIERIISSKLYISWVNPLTGEEYKPSTPYKYNEVQKINPAFDLPTPELYELCFHDHSKRLSLLRKRGVERKNRDIMTKSQVHVNQNRRLSTLRVLTLQRSSLCFIRYYHVSRFRPR
eukprot:Lithocolla_globosa_v1_NODE_848_length_3191_cov_22.651786.p1 type:complete len:445 gc:universal NODE_848_length_3191_cov_22.651786:1906-572(-)